MLLVFVAPWALMMVMGGTVADNLADPRFPFGMLFFFGPGIALQVFWALNVSLRRDKISN